MQAPAARPSGTAADRFTHLFRASWVVPVWLGAWFGSYVGWNCHTNGTDTGRSVAWGAIAGVVGTALCYALGRAQSRMSRELRATAYGALFAAAVGYLISITGGSVLKATLMGVGIGIAFGLIVFYIRYTRES